MKRPFGLYLLKYDNKWQNTAVQRTTNIFLIWYGQSLWRANQTRVYILYLYNMTHSHIWTFCILYVCVHIHVIRSWRILPPLPLGLHSLRIKITISCQETEKPHSINSIRVIGKFYSFQLQYIRTRNEQNNYGCTHTRYVKLQFF